MSASIIGYMSLLLGYKPGLARCNMIDGDLQDAWLFKGLEHNRNLAKVVMQLLYGSSAKCTDMWKAKDLEYTNEDVKAFNKMVTSDELAPLVKFKDFIINNCDMKSEMDLVVDDQTIKTYCNKFRMVGEKLTKYDLYDSKSNAIKTIYHTSTVKEDNLKSFKLYTVTALIHSLDGQTMNHTLANCKEWALDIHDAIICCPTKANKFRAVYANRLEDLHSRRKDILNNYFSSIGIKNTAKVRKQWKDIVDTIADNSTEDEIKLNPMLLK
jgi:hypothetical protein